MPARATVFVAGILLGGIITAVMSSRRIDAAVGAGRMQRGSVYFRDSIGGPWFAAGSPAPYRIERFEPLADLIAEASRIAYGQVRGARAQQHRLEPPGTAAWRLDLGGRGSSLGTARHSVRGTAREVAPPRTTR